MGTFIGNEPVTLLLHDARIEGYIAGVDVTDAQLTMLRHAALQSGSTLSALLRRAVDHVVAEKPAVLSVQAPLEVRCALRELESSKQAASAPEVAL
jgi:hypothetical protein